MFFAKILGSTLAASVLGTALIGGTALADTPASSHHTAAQSGPRDEAHDRVDQAALDALRATLDRMVDDGAMTRAQRDAVADAVRRADWDGFSVERLGDILAALVKRDAITAVQRGTILGAVAHADRNVDRLTRVLDRLTDRGILSRDQKDAVVDACHKADWDGFSLERLGDILGGLVKNGTLSSAQRDAVMDGMGRK